MAGDAPVVSARRFRGEYGSSEVRVCVLRELSVNRQPCRTPEDAAAYWRKSIATKAEFDPMKEHLVVLAIDVHRCIMAHNVVSVGTVDTCLSHAREVFRPLIVLGAVAGVVMHNHPSGSSTPSEDDVAATRDLFRAGKLLKIDLLDHVVIGEAGRGKRARRPYCSLRDLGYFYP